VKKLKYIGKIIINGYALKKSHWFKDKGVKVLGNKHTTHANCLGHYVDEKYYTELEHFRIEKND